MIRRSWSDEQLQQIVPLSRSVRIVIKALGLVPAGRNYVQVTRKIKDLDIDTSHFKGKGWNTGWESDPRTPLPPEYSLQFTHRVKSKKTKLSASVGIGRQV